jgi:CBS domain
MRQVRFRELVTTLPTVINPAARVRDAAQIMTRGHPRHLLVSGDSGLAGIIDITDICRALIDPRVSRRPAADAARARTVWHQPRTSRRPETSLAARPVPCDGGKNPARRSPEAAVTER